MTRLLRHARLNKGPLARNHLHQMAARQALVHYASGAVYSFIPKNACTTLRYSLAIANGCIAGPEDLIWVHDNNPTFVASLRDLAAAPYTFTILRCPYSRLASVFLDKLVSKRQEIWNLRRLAEESFDADDLTFREFCNMMPRPTLRKGDIHWTCQTDLLVYEDYDDWLQLERFDHAAQIITERTGLVVHDSRDIARHDTSHYVKDDAGQYADIPVHELAAMRRQGTIPTHAALYDPELVDLVGKVYRQDLDLYQEHFGTDALLFS